MREYNSYIIVSILLIALCCIQFFYYKEFNRLSKIGHVMSKFELNEQLITHEYNKQLNLNSTCLNVDLPYFDNLNQKDNNLFIQLVLEKVLKDYALHLYETKCKSNQTTLSILVNSRRKNFILEIVIIKQENETYLINNINGLCEFLDDVNQFEQFIMNKKCN